MNIAININIRGFNHPILSSCVITTLILNIMTTKIMIPTISNFLLYADSSLDSGIPLSNIKTIIEKMIDNTKIHRHPINVAIIPANSDANPVPP